MSESRTETSFLLLPPAFARGPSLFARLGEMLREWRLRMQERSDLLGLDERMLRDIGLSKPEIWRETSKPFWRP